MIYTQHPLTPENLYAPDWLDKFQEEVQMRRGPSQIRDENDHFDFMEPFSIVRGLEKTIAESDEISPGLLTNMLLLNRSMDFGWVTVYLVELLSRQERRETFSVFAELSGQVAQFGSLFPEAVREAAKESFGESMTSSMYALAALKSLDDDYVPAADHQTSKRIALRGFKNISDASISSPNGAKIDLTALSYEDVLNDMSALHACVGTIWDVMSDRTAPAEVLFTDGNTTIYRLGTAKNLLVTLRKYSSDSFDPRVEFAGKNGTEATINFTVEEDGGEISHIKSEHRSPLSLRIDNEGDRLALDIGAILDAPNTLNRRLAEVITIGDQIRSKSLDKEPWFNHNSWRFDGSMAEPDTFAQIVAEADHHMRMRVVATKSGNAALKQVSAS